MGLLAPDGRHLIELRSTGDPRESLMVVDLTTVQSTRTTVGDCPANEPVAWEDNATFIAIASDVTGKRGVRCTVDGSGVHLVGEVKNAAWFGASYGQYRLVPRLGL